MYKIADLPKTVEWQSKTLLKNLILVPFLFIHQVLLSSYYVPIELLNFPETNKTIVHKITFETM